VKYGQCARNVMQEKNIPVFMQTQVCTSYRSQSRLFEEGPVF